MACRLSQLVLKCRDLEVLARFWCEVLERDQDAELERLLAAGAELVDVGQPAEASWHVLADPEGNEFCLLNTRLDPL